jgi:signal transduction histidine kinase
MKLHFEDFDLRQLLAEVVAMMQVTADAKGVALSLVIAAETKHSIRSDPHRIK